MIASGGTRGRVRIAAHAKANLFLRVLSREQSGYHGIETVFALLELADDLIVERTASGIALEVTGADTGPVEANLVYRAAKMVLEATGNRFGVRASLTKTIPVRAGLGGGSTDGAAALHAVNRLADDAVPRHEILQFAAKLGSDVPFFASGAALALSWGRGERLYRLASPGTAPALVAVPAFGVSTRDAYRDLDSGRHWDATRGSIVLDEDAFRTWGGIGRLGGNDFEVPVFGKHPELRELFERVASTHPLLVRLSGSGSSIFAVYKNERDRDDAAMMLGDRRQRIIKTATRASAAPGTEPLDP